MCGFPRPDTVVHAPFGRPSIRSQARLAFVGVTRRHDQRRRGVTDKAEMALLAPHVRRAVTIADLIDHKSLERNDLAAVLDACAVGVLILGEGGRLVHADAAGTALLSAGDLLVSRAGTVEPWERSRGSKLRAITDCFGAGTIRLARRDGRCAILSSLPLNAGRDRRDTTRRLALFVQDDVDTPNAADVVGRVYGLRCDE